MQLRLTCSATFSKSPLNFTMYFRPLVKRPQRISTEKMFFFKNGMVGSSSQVKWCLQTKYQLLTRNLKICDGHPRNTVGNCSLRRTVALYFHFSQSSFNETIFLPYQEILVSTSYSQYCQILLVVLRCTQCNDYIILQRIVKVKKWQQQQQQQTNSNSNSNSNNSIKQ